MELRSTRYPGRAEDRARGASTASRGHRAVRSVLRGVSQKGESPSGRRARKHVGLQPGRQLAEGTRPPALTTVPPPASAGRLSAPGTAAPAGSRPSCRQAMWRRSPGPSMDSGGAQAQGHPLLLPPRWAPRPPPRPSSVESALSFLGSTFVFCSDRKVFLFRELCKFR